MTDRPSTAPITVLFVCTGNICRSPMAERLLVARAGPSVPMVVGSAGTSALVGHPLDEACAAAVRRLGAEPSGHHARRLSDALLGAADVVLTAEVAHRAAVLTRAPRLLRQAFTMAELVRLFEVGTEPLAVAGDPLDRVRELAARRGSVPVPGPGEDDIIDPYGRPGPAADECAARVARSVDVLLAVLNGGDPTAATPTLAP